MRDLKKYICREADPFPFATRRLTLGTFTYESAQDISHFRPEYAGACNEAL